MVQTKSQRMMYRKNAIRHQNNIVNERRTQSTDRKQRNSIKRKILSITFLVVFLFMIISISILISNAGDRAEIEFTNYTVKSGDTLWSISESISTKYPVRDIIHVIRAKNNIMNSTIYVGQTIEIPVLD